MPKKDLEDELLEQFGKSMLIQRHQEQTIENQVGKIHSSLDDLSDINSENLENLDYLIKQAELVCEEKGLNSEDYKEYSDSIVFLTEEEKSKIKVNKLEMISIVGVNDNISWDEYMKNISNYAERNNIDFSKDPFENLMTEAEKVDLGKRIKEDYNMKKAKCDKYDYLIASFCGVATGLIDSFFVGMPKESKLGNWTDKQVDNMVEKFSQIVWQIDKKCGNTNLKSAPKGITNAIKFLEERFKVNYDARYDSDLKLDNNVLNMNTFNHHLKSLGHAPDLIGLFFSILDQFTGEASFISNGKIIRVETVKNHFELKGSNFVSKLFAGFCNWIGHIMSDISGSRTSREASKNGRGAGVPIPFFEMFQLCNWDYFNSDKEQKNLAELSIKIFTSGYDARHGITMAIPVFINEGMIKFLWAIKSYFYHGKDWEESMPFGEKPELRRMLLVGHGTLSMIDCIDASIRSKGDVLNFALHLNITAWSRFAFAGLQEIRSIYNRNTLNIEALDNDLQQEWKRLYSKIK